MFHSLYHFCIVCFLSIREYIYCIYLFYFIESHSSKVNWRKIVFTLSFEKFWQGNRSYKYVQFKINQRQNWRAGNEIHRFLTVSHTYSNVNIILKTFLESTPPAPTTEYDIFGIVLLFVLKYCNNLLQNHIIIILLFNTLTFHEY